MAEWIYKKMGETIEDVVIALSGYSKKDLTTDSMPQKFVAAQRIAEFLINAAKKHQKVFLIGDYDADGVTSSIIMSLIFDALKIPYRVHIPRRITEGYGVSEKILETLQEDEEIIMTVDNGITARKVFEKHSAGRDVIIIDHHLAPEDGLLPEALILFDPEVFSEGSYFTHYCGAGLCYKIAWELLKMGYLHALDFEKITALAAIGTVADVMPLVEENRTIVREGLKLLPKWKALANEIGFPAELHSSDIGFKIGPCFNATGRLFDDGGQKAYQILYRSLTSGRNGIGRLVETNETRKLVQERLIQEMDAYYEASPSMYPNFLYVPKCPEGLVGILAGRLAEKTGKASFVLTETEDGVLKGSARTDGELNIKRFLDDHKNLFLKYGGHEGAGGFSMTKESYDAMVKKCQKSKHKTKDVVYEYHLNVPIKDIPALLERQEALEPFGEGMPKPIVCTLVTISSFRYMKENQMIKLVEYTPNGEVDILGFNHGTWFKENHEPKMVEVIGTMSYNYFAGKKIPQIEALDIKVF